MFCFLLLTNAGLQSMESKTEALPDWKAKENILANHYKTCLEQKLNEWHDAEGNKNILDLNQFIDMGNMLGIERKKNKEILNNVRIKGGNTITHLLVMHQCNSALAQYADSDVISLEKNEEGLTAFDIAFSQFFSLVEKIEKNETNKKVGDKDVQNLKCLYLVLSNYIKTKDNADHKELPQYGPYIWCCKLHS